MIVFKGYLGKLRPLKHMFNRASTSVGPIQSANSLLLKRASTSSVQFSQLTHRYVSERPFLSGQVSQLTYLANRVSTSVGLVQSINSPLVNRASTYAGRGQLPNPPLVDQTSTNFRQFVVLQ